MLDPEIDYKGQAWAQAVAENNLEAAISVAEAAIEIERMKIEAFRKEALIRGELYQLLGTDIISPETVTFQQYAMARAKAEAIVDADAAIRDMEARLAARKDG